MRLRIPQIVVAGLVLGLSQAAVPSAAQPASACVEGRVRDSAHGIPAPGARVELRWTDDDGDDAEEERWTDADGRFRACGIPEGARVTVSAELGAGPGPSVEATPGFGDGIELSSPLPSPEAASGLLGTVREDGSGRAVSGAEVRLPDLDRSTTTDRDGTFLFETVEPGSHRVEIQHLSYGTVTDTVHLVAGRPLQMRLSVTPAPIRIAGVEARARSRVWLGDRADLRRRMQGGFGDFITREEILERNEPPLRFLLNSVPGVRSEYVAHPWGNTYYPVVRSCGIPAVFVDGARVAIQPASGVGIDDFLSSNIDVVEIYKGPAGAPLAYSGVGGRCGVILIWTREPG